MLKKNDIIDLTIENCGLDGSGIGHFEGMAVFVPASVTGDVIKAHVLKVKKSYAFAKVESVIKPSPFRIEAECPVSAKCGGCAFGHIDYETELQIKESHVSECFRRIAGLNPEFEKIIGCDSPYRYRNKAQFPVEYNNGKMLMGFYGPHSHRVVHCPDCILQPKEFSVILDAFSEYMTECGVTAYDEDKHTGLVRHLYLRKADATGEVMVCPVINGNSLPNEDKLIKRITDVSASVKSIVINSNTEITNVVMGKKCRTIFGNGYITDILCGLKFRLSPLSFYQVNHNQAEKLYGKAAEYAGLTGEENVLDLYCGTGTIGLSLAGRAKNVIGVEIVEQAIEDAKINAMENNITNVRFLCSDASEAVKILAQEGIHPDVVILDPPRKGCSDSVVSAVASFDPDKIVYVSCDPATLARDCSSFGKLGYNIEKASTVDMFARTGHVETVVLMSKVK